ncbi:uncharacterized protein Z520_07824 [Fonsecaea multimorphosa CBS 102226]|uniref:Uncharacterized protein n=1 Tax=Fonsecaea multimorphosa CBS 102226 TaxID=1442371 RepID=A0A0D2KIV3_9EURO|nr:uncharacterized protein Z520_07824 [Fonsecaea multimorphosa CBS 102226]KIX96558.1 hypothetical protein Z520_07824 [Fonsecaea multimorphosa CBS 102226]
MPSGSSYYGGSSSGSSSSSSREYTSKDYDRLATAVTAAAKGEYGTYGGTVRDSNGNYGRRGAISESDSPYHYSTRKSSRDP